MKPGLPQRRPQRLKNYNYSRAGGYFITICTARRMCLFGDIRNEEIYLNKFGEIVQICWRDLRRHYSHITFDAFVIMPNHVHGIIMVDELAGSGSRIFSAAVHENAGGETPPLRKPATLSQIIGYFKYQSSKQINGLRNMPRIPVWQRSFYDHVIRDEASLNRIREYIATNPLRWCLDRENPDAHGKDEFDTWLAKFK
jgi:putative transposase